MCYLTVIGTRSSTAGAGEDFVHLDTDVHFISGQSEWDTIVMIINDRLQEPQESFVIELYEGRDDPRSIVSQVNVTIYDDDYAGKAEVVKMQFGSHTP